MKQQIKVLSYVVFVITLVSLYNSSAGLCMESIDSQYMKHDFYPVLKQCEIRWLSMFPSNGLLIPSDILVDDLSPEEVRFLSTYQYSETVIIGIGYSIDFAITYAKQHEASIPSNGVAIMLRQGVFRNKEIFHEFDKLKQEEQLVEACRGINPGTGRFVESFSNPEWHKFGVFIEPADGEEAIKYFPEMLPDSIISGGDKKAGMAPYQTWHVVVFGEKPGRILVDKFVWRRMGSPSEESSGPCGGCGKKKKS